MINLSSRFLVLLTCFWMLNLSPVKADSPLTSTGFWEAYQKERIIKYARAKGKMNKKIAKFLMKPEVSMGLKAAVCNSLGWNFDGQKNALFFLNLLVEEYHFSMDKIDWNKLSADELACYGYLLAMDDYFHPGNGLQAMNLALEKNGKSLAIQMLVALVKSQIAFDEDWCAVYTVVQSVNENKSLDADLNETAREIIMEYIRLYQDSCSK